MSIKIEEVLNEVKYAGGINTALPVSASATASFSGAVVNSGTVTNSGAVTNSAAVTVPGASGLVLGTGGPVFIVGSVNPVTGPVQVSVIGSVYINTGGTGPASRLYVATSTNATGWTPITTAA